LADPVLELVDVSYSYPHGPEALAGVSLEIARGGSVALVGPNGAGKSTLLLHLSGTLRPTTGAVSVAGLEVTRGNLREIRRRVGLVFQDPDDQLFTPTAFDDVAFGLLNLGLEPAAIETRVAEALSRVGLDGFADRAPFRMSAGEKRRAAIATVLAMEPEVLVLDEPTSDLDPRGRRELIRLVEGLDITKIVATHDLEMALEVAGRAVILDRGRVAADGPIRRLFDDEPLMKTHGLERPLSLALDGRR
jgi:cobalt/nickel transport system ATP-binding protein